MKTKLFLLLAVLVSPVMVAETRQLDSHEHGIGELNIAVDGTTVAMEFHAPGADIVGFEYAAKSAEDHAAIDAAITTLSDPLALFVMSDAAQCRVVQASAELESEKGHDDHDEHDHHEHNDETSHTEFYAEYRLTCANPAALSEITFDYFSVFKNTHELEVRIISASGAKAFEVEHDYPTLDLRGRL